MIDKRQGVSESSFHLHLAESIRLLLTKSERKLYYSGGHVVCSVLSVIYVTEI